MSDQWGYKSHNGPNEWHKWFPVGKEGTRQSPVAIVASSSSKDSSLGPVQYHYNPNHCLKVSNTGASWKLDVNSDESSLKAGPLDSEYKLLQIHAHWGACDGHGSEHTLDGVSYDAELHLVHFNTKYKEAGVALDKPDGLAVLGVFIKVGAAHPEFEKLCQSLEDIVLRGSATAIQEPIDPAAFLPDDKSYFTYLGSLTTPPLLESVTWIVFRQNIEISEEQLAVMRRLKVDENEECDCMADNYRPPCPLGNRTMRLAQF